MTKSIAHTLASIRANKLRDITRTEMLEVCDLADAAVQLRDILKCPEGTDLVEWAKLMMVNKP